LQWAAFLWVARKGVAARWINYFFFEKKPS
jgi:hypothetical protein